MRAALLMGAAVLAVLIVTGCAPGSDPAATSAAVVPAPSAPAADPTASAPSEPATFDTIDGIWCPADGSTACLTISQPDVLTDGAATDRLADPSSSPESTPCFATALVDAATDMAEVAVFYCPAGVSPDAGVRAAFDDVGYDRLYFTQNPPDVDTWFRAGDLEAATAG
ncbi:MAG TPA: hypothetical protein VFN24_14085 [Microbacterium sp.]|nr:hypothetical protein [Microbacterium sp.]